VVADLGKKVFLDVEIVKKSDFSLLGRLSLPKFPAVEIDGSIVFEGQDVTYEELESAITNRS